MATVKTIIEKAYTKVNGEFEALAESSDDFKTYLNVLNQVMEMWAETPYVKWQSLFDMDYTLPDPVASGTLIYAVADADRIHVGNTPFDSVYFLNDDGDTIGKYKMTDQAFFDASKVSDICVLVSDGLHLKAVKGELVGTTIRLPAYVYPPIYTIGIQEVKIDSVSWLIATMSAFICDASPVPFIARNAEKFAKQADVYMKAMRADNRRRQHLVIKSVTGADNGNPVPTDDLISLLGVGGIIGSGGGVIDGGAA